MTELINFRPNLRVRDVPAAIAFYRDVIGFDLRVEFDDGSFALLGSGAAEVALVRHEDPPAEGAYLYVRGVAELYDRCKAHGFEITRGLELEPWGLRDFVVRDPDGHLIAIGERVDPNG